MSSLFVRLFVKNYDDVKNPRVRGRYGSLAGVVGIVCNLILSALKIGIGLLVGSLSISADGFNNLTDMGSSVVAMLGFKLAGKPADRDHPFGHGRMEYMSAFIVAVLILLVGFELLKSSVTALVNGEAAPEYSLISILILAFSVIIKLWLFFFNRKLSKSIDSEVLAATAKDSLNDCVATTAILISVGVTRFVELPFNLDAVMGILVAVFILISGIGSAKDTINQILGQPPEEETINEISDFILSFPEFYGIHDLIVHNYGPGRQFASVHVEVPQNIDIVKCHEEIDLCEKLLFERTGINVVIHMDPINTDDETITATKSAMQKALKEIDEGLTLHDFRMTPLAENQTNLIFDVVVPSKVKIPADQLKQEISEKANKINSTFVCVITLDNDFTGK